MLEEFQYEISRASKRPLVHLDYDATACYDRIVMSFGSLASRSYGQHRSVVFINAATQEDAKYYLKTQLGVSEKFYKHCKIFPIYGSGQGAGNSPGIWCVISSVLFHAYDEKAHGATFRSPQGEIEAQVFMIGFVDDTSGSTNDFNLPKRQSPEHYIAKASKDAQRWNDVLRVSGGALEDTKCSYHFLYFDFTIDGLPYLCNGQIGPRISIQFNNNNSPYPLKQLSAYQSHKTLGVMKSPASTDRSLFHALAKKNSHHTSVMARSPFNRTDAWAYYHSVYLPSITYPMPSSSLCDKHCKALQRQFKKALLPKCGYNRCTPNAIVYGSPDYGGIGLRSLTTERGISQVYMFLACLRSQGLPSDLAHITVSWGQWLAGTSVSILDDVKTPLPHLAPMMWLPSLRSFLATVDCRIELAQDFIIPLQRENDSFVMDHALQFTTKPLDLQLLNACRLYLGITLVSDITTCNGESLSLAPTLGLQLQHSTLRGLTAYQDYPSTKAWNLWRKFLSTLTTGNTDRQLNQPLGKWLKTGYSTLRKWNCYLCEQSSRLFILDGANYRIYQETFYGWFSPTDQLTLIVPAAAVPVTTTPAPFNQRILHKYSHRLDPVPPEIPSTFASHVTTLPKWEQDLLSGFVLCCSPTTLFEQFNNGLVLCSDGSVALFTGSFGAVCVSHDNKRLFELAGPAPGFRTSSFRAESYGYLSLLRSIYHLCLFHHQPLPGDLHFYTDSLSMIETVRQRLEWQVEYPYSTMDPDWDLHQSIIYTLRQFPSIPPLSHVKAHQDRYHPYETLSLEAQLNVQADRLAGDYCYPSTLSSRFCPLITGTVATLHGPSGTITSNYRSTLRRLSSDPVITEYLQTKHHWSPAVFDSICWDTHGSVIRANFHRRHFLTKYVHNWLPVGTLKQHYATHYTCMCPNCPTIPENRSHFLRCPSRRNWTGPMFDELNSFWTENSFDPHLATILREVMRLWLADTPIVLPTVPPQYQVLITRQTLVGWDQVFFGRFVKDWIRLQDAFVSTHELNPIKFSGHRSICGTIKIIWQHVHNLWTRRNLDVHGHNAPT